MKQITQKNKAESISSRTTAIPKIKRRISPNISNRIFPTLFWSTAKALIHIVFLKG